MTVNIPTHYTDQFSDNVMHDLQRKKTKYRMHVMEESHAGEKAVAVNRYGQVDFSEVTTRFEAMGREDPTTERVWCTPLVFDANVMVDTFDLLKVELQNPESELAKAVVMGAARKIDDIISDAFFADMTTGQGGASTSSFDTTNDRVDAAVGASADTGMNVEKLIEARRRLLVNEVDLDDEEGGQLCLAIHPLQEEDLLNQAKVINSDYSGKTVLTDGKLDYFCGYKIICTTKVPSNSSYRLNPAWVRSGMHLGVWSDIKIQVHQRPDIRGVPFQTYAYLMMGATRTEEGRVIQIESLES